MQVYFQSYDLKLSCKEKVLQYTYVQLVASKGCSCSLLCLPSGLNRKGPVGCWQSLNLSADSMLHSRALLALHRMEAFSLSVWFLIAWLKRNLHLKSKNPRNNNRDWGRRDASYNSGAETSGRKRGAARETSNVWTSRHGNVRAPSQAASVSISAETPTKKEYISSVATEVKEKLQRHHYRSLSEANLRHWVDWLMQPAVKIAPLKVWKKVQTVINALKYAVY